MTQKTRTRLVILDAAVNALADRGLEGVRVSDVAELAGVSTGLVHYHFGTRGQLLVQALHHAFGYETSRGASAVSAGTVVERLAGQVERILPLPGAQEREWTLWLELWAGALRDDELRRVSVELYAAISDSLVALLHEGESAGEFRLENPTALVDRLIAVSDGYGLRVMLGDPRITAEIARDELKQVLEAGLAITLT